MILWPTVTLKPKKIGSSELKGARFPLDLCLEAG